jgi:hypothetical protein
MFECWERILPLSQYNTKWEVVEAVLRGETPKITSDCPPLYRSLLTSCLSQLAADRPTFATAVKILGQVANDTAVDDFARDEHRV